VTSFAPITLYATQPNVLLVHPSVPAKNVQELIAFDNIATALPHVRAGKLRALAVTTAKRTAVVPDVPTLAESGLPSYELSSWQAVFAPAGTPKPIVDRLYGEIAKILQMPEIQKRLSELGLDLSGMPPQELAALVKTDMPRLGKIVGESGAKAE